jgi:hypothetical protein
MKEVQPGTADGADLFSSHGRACFLAATPLPAAHRPLLDRRANPSGLRSVSARPSNQHRYGAQILPPQTPKSRRYKEGALTFCWRALIQPTLMILSITMASAARIRRYKSNPKLSLARDKVDNRSCSRSMLSLTGCQSRTMTSPSRHPTIYCRGGGYCRPSS